MKLRSQLFSVAALVLLSWTASAQTRTAWKPRPKQAPIPVQEYGSVERTKLLHMAPGKAAEDGVRRLGSAQRRALLTSGRQIQLPVKQRSNAYRR